MMTAIPRPCIDCQRATTHGSRCILCSKVYAEKHERRRGSRHQRGYTNDWYRLSQAVLDRDDYTCAYCGGFATTADHRIPKARGGPSDASNLVAACRSCNSKKGDR